MDLEPKPDRFPKEPKNEGEVKALEAPKKKTKEGGPMPKKYEYYYCKHYTSIAQSGSTALTTGFYYTGIRAEKTFMRQGTGETALYRQLGFVDEDYLIKNIAAVVRDKENSHTAAARNGLIFLLDFALVPKEAGKVVSPYGNRYKTYVMVSADISFNAAASALLKQNFALGNPSQVYVVERGSITQRKSKSTTWRNFQTQAG